MSGANRLINETSPYLLQHATNPVDWYPWGGEAFQKALSEGKPIFLSIGYSACHWCHVMERESFEDEKVAALLNEYFVPVKVDREERPDIDNIYMRVCQAFTGGGGWPMSIFMTGGQKPFFAGTYYPKGYFLQLLGAIRDRWESDRPALLGSGDEITEMLKRDAGAACTKEKAPISEAVAAFRQMFDSRYGGFGAAPKFPAAHNLMFLLRTEPDMAEKTLRRMYKGGIFDHIGCGFSRYSTDRFWLVPHFEKMLYDNALLVVAYLQAYELTGDRLYARIAEKTLLYMSNELSAPEGGFYSSQDADSDGVEGKYYLFSPEELTGLLGEEAGRRFNAYFDITDKGNFEGKNIPNRINGSGSEGEMDALLPKVYEYRRARTSLRLDNKILTVWNALAAAAFADAYRILGKEEYRSAALEAVDFIERRLTEGDTVFVGVTEGKRGTAGFLDDYAFYIYALICLHQATRDEKLLERAQRLAEKAVRDYFDDENGGFFFSGRQNETLIMDIKETLDGAMPCGNSVMAYNLSRLAVLSGSEKLLAVSEKQNAFINAHAAESPAGCGFYLYSALPEKEVVCVTGNDKAAEEVMVRSDWIFRLSAGDPRYPPINGRTTYYVCGEGVCFPPSNDPPEN
ncbi:MAG: thioredoxin domain-containing protein [Clostridia bacterium]|nr:thioredoxin domain-containing protein [Clostridia bacterium]